MKLTIMPKNPAWLVWLATVILLACGLAGSTPGFVGAIALSFAQTVFFLLKHPSLRTMSVQIRFAFTLLLLVCLIPGLRWLYWLPTLGTSAMLVFGYCPMARFLSLLPWNRREPLTAGLIGRTFFSAPVISRPGAPALLDGCGGEQGVCELEARAATFHPQDKGKTRLA